jgi:hypothetical protein
VKTTVETENQKPFPQDPIEQISVILSAFYSKYSTPVIISADNDNVITGRCPTRSLQTGEAVTMNDFLSSISNSDGDFGDSFNQFLEFVHDIE